jgi:elongation factor P
MAFIQAGDFRKGITFQLDFHPDMKFPKAHIETKNMQYLYNDGELYHFMDSETYEQVPLMKDQVEDAIIYLRENDFATIKFYKGSAFLVEAPNFVNLEVIETEPGIKGDTATNVTKAATVETGAVIQVPIFIETGEVIQIDTRTGEYLSRAK